MIQAVENVFPSFLLLTNRSVRVSCEHVHVFPCGCYYKFKRTHINTLFLLDYWINITGVGLGKDKAARVLN